ncbi:MAG: hypothetical protein ACLGIJ_07275 [Candidatus Limnocylindria bacterium]
MPPWLIALALVLGLIVLVPARRLQLAGFSGRVIGSYAFLLWAFGMLAAMGPGATRALLPMLLIAYVAPFVAAPDTLARVMRRPKPGGGPPGPPIKDVTPRNGEGEPGGEIGPTGRR